jgi:hypothetical protein
VRKMRYLNNRAPMADASVTWRNSGVIVAISADTPVFENNFICTVAKDISGQAKAEPSRRGQAYPLKGSIHSCVLRKFYPSLHRYLVQLRLGFGMRSRERIKEPT